VAGIQRLAPTAIPAKAPAFQENRFDVVEFILLSVITRPERHGAERVKMQTGAAIPSPLQADGWALSFFRWSLFCAMPARQIAQDDPIDRHHRHDRLQFAFIGNGPAFG
jgi:hypothetical protein